MATNKVTERSCRHTIAVPSGTTSGDPLVIGGGLSCVALTNRDSSGNATVEFPYEVPLFDVSVDGRDVNGDRALAAYEPVFYTAGGTPTLDGKTTGKLFGFLMEGVTSGATETVKVLPVIGLKYNLNTSVIAGGAAGDHTVTGIALGDEIVAVLEFATAASIATLTDRTAEFTITAADTINNTGGTATTSDSLLVIWVDRT